MIIRTMHDRIEGDFGVVAEYKAGLSRWKSWLLTIARDGRVMRKVDQEEEASHVKTLSKEEMNALRTKIKQADSFNLEPRYWDASTCQSTLTLIVVKKRKPFSTLVYGYYYLKNNEDVKRFLVVWRELLTLVPSPNPEDRPDIYDPLTWTFHRGKWGVNALTATEASNATAPPPQ